MLLCAHWCQVFVLLYFVFLYFLFYLLCPDVMCTMYIVHVLCIWLKVKCQGYVAQSKRCCGSNIVELQALILRQTYIGLISNYLLNIHQTYNGLLSKYLLDLHQTNMFIKSPTNIYWTHQQIFIESPSNIHFFTVFTFFHSTFPLLMKHN